jgi:hypothetical protein
MTVQSYRATASTVAGLPIEELRLRIHVIMAHARSSPARHATSLVCAEVAEGATAMKPKPMSPTNVALVGLKLRSSPRSSFR